MGTGLVDKKKMGHLLKLKYASVPRAHINIKSVPFRRTTVQMPNLALVEMKQITVSK